MVRDLCKVGEVPGGVGEFRPRPFTPDEEPRYRTEVAEDICSIRFTTGPRRLPGRA
ncbi:hypothetical protein [Streptomyces luteolus]|uniref:Uncharacterized protein n=1 Tax=Streptomyces luteolus TaxID=3043615 RepID=A0ABT6SUG7_9ACTN|nr:hypothetical protein [Streptomyces sp. B-S-A12]MDI3419254.1 hypothetical protein [Streptomyces sp. B-S-A12]